MKNLAIGILLIATAVFGGLWLRQSHKATQAEASADGLQQQVSELQSGLAAQEKQTTRLRAQLKELRADAAARIQESLTNQAQLASAKASGQTNSKASNPLAAMFKDPAMRQMMKNQQKTVLSGMIDKNYAKLFADLHLTPEQTSTLKDMLLNKQLAAAEMGMAMFADDSDATNRTEMAQQVKAANDAADAQIKAFLGDDNFAQFQTYEKSMAERTAVSGLKEQLAGGPAALTNDQEQQLIQAMTQERQNFKFTTDFSDKSKFTGDFASLFTEDKIDVYFQESGQLNQQYLTRAQTFLSPDQLAGFEKYLNSQQAMQKAGMQMAAKMFAPSKPAGD